MMPCKRRNNSTNSSGSSTRSTGMQNCRRKLQDKFEEADRKIEYPTEPKAQEVSRPDRSVLSVLTINDNTRRALRNGAERLTRTFNTVRTSIGTFSQRFKISTKRRQILQEGPMTPNCATPHTFTKQILGRTPTKMYSPFGIESPYRETTTYNKENMPPTKLKR
ncbi:hypothetical protein NQ317_013522 [Molorchus minor]|uniref:Uncharacterized protein n=1 Tax=Molorchus minor TaxID=1323400 RepID=A0ABQ9JY53_9CUCU|nr:hypothetical protein NQ317_013522 [Molorchus minor]